MVGWALREWSVYRADDDDGRGTVFVVAQRIAVAVAVFLTGSCDELFRGQPLHGSYLFERVLLAAQMMVW